MPIAAEPMMTKPIEAMPVATARNGIWKTIPTGQASRTPPTTMMPATTDASRMVSPSTTLRSVVATATRRAVKACMAMPTVLMITSRPRRAPRAPNSAGTSTRAATMLSR